MIFKIFIQNKINELKKIKSIIKELRNSTSETPCKKSDELLKWIKKTLIKPFGVDLDDYKEMVALCISFMFKTKTKFILKKFSAIERGFADKKSLTNANKDEIRVYSDEMEMIIDDFK